MHGADLGSRGQDAVAHGLGGGDALRRVGLQRVHHDLLEGGGDGRELTGWRDLRRADHVELEHFVVRPKEATRGEALPHHHAERIHIGASVEGPPVRLLGRHIADLPAQHAGARRVGLRAALGDAEVDHLHVPREGQEDVLRADVAVDDVEQLSAIVAELVRGVEPVGDLRGDPRGEVDREATSLLRQLLDELEEAAAVDELHDHQVGAGVFEQLLHADHAGVLDAGGEARLIQEHPDELRLTRQVRVHHLDRDELREARRATSAPEIERCHTPRRDVAEDLVPCEDLSGTKLLHQRCIR